MKWSKVKSSVESRFARSVSGKVHIFSTSYAKKGNGCQCGRGWITYNKEQIVEFETILYLNRVYGKHEPTNSDKHVVIAPESRTTGSLSERGEWSRFELHRACKNFLDLQIDDAVNSGNPLIQGLAFLDRRFGRQRAADYPADGLHPLAKRLLEIRCTEDRSCSRNEKIQTHSKSVLA
jgi:hypothetical protein